MQAARRVSAKLSTPKSSGCISEFIIADLSKKELNTQNVSGRESG